METGYRETAQFKEYEDIKKLLEEEKLKVKAINVGASIMRGIGWFAVTVSTLLAIGLLCWFTMFRGIAFGVTARQNAETEARRAGTAMFGPSAEFRVLCTGQWGQSNCSIIKGDKTIYLNCDEDDPIANDGCTGASRQN